ncbi:MAG: rhodanese-like domain-containing protein [Lachnospiraceae bacterium]
MERIEIEDLRKLEIEKLQILDLRKEQEHQRNHIANAICIPYSELSDRYTSLDKNEPVYVYCYTGDVSEPAADFLEEKGWQVIHIEGGYRSYLRLQLTELMDDEQERADRTKEIERSIMKKFHKNIWTRFVKAIKEYDMIQEGDRIAVCISGGKDSMLLAKLFQELMRHKKMDFSCVFLIMDPGYNPENKQIIMDNAKLLGIPVEVFHSEIFDTVATIQESPCYLCARMRRGYLYSKAKELGCNKIALGHHFDDVIETVLMGMFYAGKIETMMPKLHSKNFDGMELIRPMYMIREADICAWRDRNRLGFIQCACRFTEHCSTCGGDKTSKREEMKELIADLRKKSDVIDKNIFRSIHDINLGTVIGYHKHGVSYHFVDDYDGEEQKKI